MAADKLTLPGQYSSAYVEDCPVFGAGFMKLPGSDTCVEIGGSVRADYIVTDPVVKDEATTSFFARGSVHMDSRTATEYGTVRSYVSFYMFQQTPDSAALPTGDDDASLAKSGFVLERAFIQFYGLTAGYTVSMFDFSAGLNYFRPRVSYTKTTLGSYTVQLNPGLTATLSVEDSTYRRTDIDLDPYGAYGGSEAPDVVGRVLYEDPSFAWQVSGALHQINGSSSQYDTEYGYAVQGGFSYRFGIPKAGVELMDPVKFDYQIPRFVMSAAYASGAVSYLGFNNSDVVDAVAYNGDYDLASGWNVMAAYRQPWSDKWRSSISGSYAALDFSSQSTLPNLREFQIGGNLVFSPIQDFDIGGELVYIKQNVPFTNSMDDDRFVGRLRVERRF